MATHSSVLAWRIPETGEPGGLPSMGSHGVGHDWSDLAATAVFHYICVFVCVYVCVCTYTCAWVLSCVQLFVTPWTVAYQAPLSMEFSRQECWNGLPWPPPRDLLDPGIEPTSLAHPALAGTFLTRVSPGRPIRKTLIWKDTCTPVFIAALFTTARIWKQTKCPSTGG